MSLPENKGFLWNYHGFTKLNLWGCYITGNLFAASGAGLLTAAILLWNHLSDRVFIRLVMLSIGCFAATTAIAVGGIFMLVYFWGRNAIQSAEANAERG